MKLNILDMILCRTPAFSLEDDPGARWQDLKSLIRDASPSFYRVIADLNAEELKTADKKISFSIWKYFNRGKYRATPYGGFAAFTLVPFLKENGSLIVLNRDMICHQFTDWKQKDTYLAEVSLLAETSAWFQTNSTVYASGQEYRYIRVKNGCFEIASVTSFPQLSAILKLCREKAAKAEIYRTMSARFRMERRQVSGLLEQMLSLQLLVTEQCPNISGEDYFRRLSIEDLNSASPYTIAERKLISGGMNNGNLKDISPVIGFLAKHLPETTNNTLTTFREAFLKKFEHRVVPLAVAMDPETGVGYGNLAQTPAGQEISDILGEFGRNKPSDLHISYTALHRFLLDKLMSGGIIRLEEFEDHTSKYVMPLPNTLSVLFHFWNGHPVIENAGGCTANVLLGRFTLASPDLEEFGRKIVSIEEQANPDVLFFDIAYQAEASVDNVNRRKQLYQFELPILTWSCDPSPLTFDDILVSVRGSEIILWSKKHQIRMVPRIPSAYNYVRSDLAVYRFLCDLQHQQVKSDLNFKMPYFFPDLSFYPRVVYKEVILSPAMWRLPQDLLIAGKFGTEEERKAKLLSWLQEKSINFQFKAGHADQTLCFDPGISADIEAFLLYCNQNTRKEIYISEALISNDDVVQDHNGKKYAAQFIASYSHENTVYKPYKLTEPAEAHCQPNDHAVFPGEDWLYFEIYCHPARTDQILCNPVSSFLEEIKKNIRKWFFIRYDDPKPHIRLRLHLKEPSEAYQVIGRLKSLLAPDCANGLISDIQIKTYYRENERYGANRIELVEQLFFADSKHVLSVLARKTTTEQLYIAALIIMQRLTALALPDISDQVSFIKDMAGHFSAELALTNENFKKLNRSFQDLKDNAILGINSPAVKPPMELEELFVKVFSTCNSQDECRKLLADLLHMHVNRLFNSDQRSREGILYHYLLKILLARRAFSAVPAELPDVI